MQRVRFPSLPFGRSVYPFVPGLLLVATVALAARFMAIATPLPAIIFALMLGMAFSNVASDSRHRLGVAIGSRHLLRAGVALLGVQITAADFLGLGLASVVITIVSLLLTLGLGLLVSRALGATFGAAIVSSAAVAICGASAAMAVAASLPKDSVSEEEVARTIAGVTVFGTLAMLVLPFVAAWLELSVTEAGLFLGGSIHEVAQAVGAGFSVSDEVGTAATIVKLLRVACLGAVVLGVAMISRRGNQEAKDKTPLLPSFVVCFLGLACLSSFGAVPAELRAFSTEVSRWFLLMAIAALGMRVSASELIRGGAAPMVAIAVNSSLVVTFVLAGIMLASGR